MTHDLDRMHRLAEDALMPLCARLETLNLDAIRHHSPERITERHADFVRIVSDMKQTCDRYLKRAARERP
jgi:hypothetical protein